jgi:RNA polymerase primary sigma factor
LTQAIEDNQDQVHSLIRIGKERGYVLYDEVNDVLPAEVHSAEDVEELLSTLKRFQIDVFENVLSAEAARAAGETTGVLKIDLGEEPAQPEEAELDLTPGTVARTEDSVRVYMREMGTVPLLTREGEVTLAKRMERGQRLVLKATTRSPIVTKELQAIAEDLRHGRRSIKEIVRFDDEELTQEKIDRKTN